MIWPVYILKQNHTWMAQGEMALGLELSAFPRPIAYWYSVRFTDKHNGKTHYESAAPFQVLRNSLKLSRRNAYNTWQSCKLCYVKALISVWQ
jgi:hypothetical protein